MKPRPQTDHPMTRPQCFRFSTMLLASLLAASATTTLVAADDTRPLPMGADQTGQSTLWWRNPAAAGAWTQAMPMGNGRLGVMMEGGVDTDTLWLNDDTLWSGEPFTPSNTTALKALPEVRKLLIERNEAEATNLVNQKMLGVNNEAYMPLGQLVLHFPAAAEVKNYLRTLDLTTGIATVAYEQDGVKPWCRIPTKRWSCG
jgi:alpha-L-fucosidase 2